MSVLQAMTRRWWRNRRRSGGTAAIDSVSSAHCRRLLARRSTGQRFLSDAAGALPELPTQPPSRSSLSSLGTALKPVRILTQPPGGSIRSQTGREFWNQRSAASMTMWDAEVLSHEEPPDGYSERRRGCWRNDRCVPVEESVLSRQTDLDDLGDTERWERTG